MSSSPTQPLPATLDDLLAQHRKELRDLQSRITQKKKSATKKTRRGVNDECERMEREVKERHGMEVKEFDDGPGGKGWPVAEGEEEEEEREHDLDRLDLGDDDVETKGDGNKEGEKSTSNNTTINATIPPPTEPSPSSSSPQSQPQQQKKPSRQKARLARRAAEASEASAQATLEASSQTDHRALEKTKMSSLITSLGLEEIEIRSDGHCMYSAVAHALSSSSAAEKYTYLEVRKETANFILSHPKDYEPFLDLEEGESLDQYAKRIGETAEWGGELELNAIARWSGRRIRVVQGEGGVRSIDAGVGEGAGEGGEKEDERGEIWLAYYRKSFGLGEHYNGLRRKRKETKE